MRKTGNINPLQDDSAIAPQGDPTWIGCLVSFPAMLDQLLSIPYLL
jgi:hypothetical protein